MSSSETHHPAVCAYNTTTGVARSWWHLPWYLKFSWTLLNALYTFIGVVLDVSMATHVAWEAFFVSVWTLICVYLPEITS